MAWGDSSVRLGDNPIYMLAPGDQSGVASAVYATVGKPLGKCEERLFNNPMYGDKDPQQYEVPVSSPTNREVERLFENPVYGQPDPMDYEVPMASPRAGNFLQHETTPTSDSPSNI